MSKRKEKWIRARSGEPIIQVPPQQNIGSCIERAIQDGVDFPYADLRGVELFNVNLSGGNFTYADFTGAKLNYSNLSRCVLCGADFTGAGLREVNMTEADLEDADFTDADLDSVNLAKAEMTRGTCFTGANMADTILFGVPDGVPGLPIIQIQGSRHAIQCLSGVAGPVAVGCQVRHIETWLETAEEIGKANNYTDLQIMEYQIYLEAVAEVLRQRRLHTEEEGQ